METDRNVIFRVLKSYNTKYKATKYVVSTLIGIILLLTGCITTFEPQGLQESAGLLVVEGMIMETGTTIKLNRTVGIYSASTRKDVNDARIQLIDDNGLIIAVAGQHIIDAKAGSIYTFAEPFTFSQGTKYALDIQIGEQHYQSAFESPFRTPEIDELTWKLKEDNSIDIFVSTHDPDNDVIYYLWDFEEDWEIKSRMFGAYRYIPSFGLGEVIEQSLSGPNNTYYCWDSDKSKSILLGTCEKLTVATINNKLIYNFPPYTSRFSYLYSILVKQYGISQQAYAFYENLQKNVEQGGSLFAPQQTELRGNIKCISHPDEDVLGYVVFTNKAESRLFIDVAKMWLDVEYDCGDIRNFPVDKLGDAHRNGFGILSYSNGIYSCAPLKCLDCTLRGGTKNKPDFWPNDHQ